VVFRPFTSSQDLLRELLPLVLLSANQSQGVQAFDLKRYAGSRLLGFGVLTRQLTQDQGDEKFKFFLLIFLTLISEDLPEKDEASQFDLIGAVSRLCFFQLLEGVLSNGHEIVKLGLQLLVGDEVAALHDQMGSEFIPVHGQVSLFDGLLGQKFPVNSVE